MFSVGAQRLLVTKGWKAALAQLDGTLLTDFLYKAGDSYSFYFFVLFSRRGLSLKSKSPKV